MRTIKIKADTYRQDYNYRECKQNDDIPLEVTLLEGGVELDLSGYTITLNWIKSDNTVVTIAGDTIKVIGNIVSLILPRDCTRAVGQAKFELVITDNTSKQISTFPLSLEIIGSVIQGQQASNNVATLTEELNNANIAAINTKNELKDVIDTADLTTYASQGQMQEVNSQLADKEIYKTSSDIKASGDGVTPDDIILNGYLQAGSDRRLFLNQGRHKLNAPIVITQPNTLLEGNAYARGWISDRLRKSTLVANHYEEVLRISIPSSENTGFIQNINIDGDEKAKNGLIIDDYEFQGNYLENIHVMNVSEDAYVLNGNNYATYYERLFSAKCKTALSIKKGNTHNVVFKGCHFYSYGTILDLLTDVDPNLNTSKMIVFDSCDFSHTSYEDVEQVLIKIGRVNNVVFNNCYFESPQTQIKEYLIELGTLSYTATNIKFINCNFSGTNYNYFIKLTNAINFVIDNCYFENYPNIAWFKASTDVNDTKQQFMQGMLINQSLPGNKLLVSTDIDKTPLQEEKVLFLINQKQSFYGVHQRGGFKVSNNPTDNYIYRGYDKDQITYPHPFVEIKKNGLHLGGGTIPPKPIITLDSEGRTNLSNGAFLGVNYTNPLRIGEVYFWCNPSTVHVMYKRGSAPTSNTDGTQLTQ